MDAESVGATLLVLSLVGVAAAWTAGSKTLFSLAATVNLAAIFILYRTR